MGAGILPTSLYNGKLYFLFGKENQYADTPGWADFGGGTDNNESYLETAIREGVEETTGFLGNEKDMRRYLSRGTYQIENDGHYNMFLFEYKYDPQLPHYYNNNQQFLQKKLNPSIIQKMKIFEKSEIRWVCIDNLKQMRNQFRHYFRKIVDRLLDERAEIYAFIKKQEKHSIGIGKTRMRKRMRKRMTRKIK